MPEHQKTWTRVGRRAFFKEGTLLLAAATSWSPTMLVADEPPSATRLRIGLITDLHYADKPPAGTRHYRETLSKLAEATAQFQQAPLSFVVELGDLIDAADSVEVEQGYLKTIHQAFSAVAAERHYVLGNHCVDMLTKDEFLSGVEQTQSYYSFERGGCHFVVLDACFRSDGQPYGRKNSHWTDANIPAAQLEWLTADLAKAQGPVIVFAHQRLDVSHQHGVKNGAAVRSILEAAGKVSAVFQGHSHQNDLQEIGGIPYCTLVAMVEGTGAERNAYSVLEVATDCSLRLHGFRQQRSFQWKS